jgi:ATP-dependent Zn protease
MKKVVRLTESGLKDIIRKMIQEQETDRYMFFSNLEQIHRQTGLLLERNKEEIHEILENGHDWAQDHIATAKESIDQVFDFLMNEEKGDGEPDSFDMMQEGRKKAGTKLCSRGKSAAKSKFKVYPSAYANGYAVQVCKGSKPGLDGKKRCSPPYC